MDSVRGLAIVFVVATAIHGVGGLGVGLSIAGSRTAALGSGGSLEVGAASVTMGESNEGLRVFISVDLEGIGGVGAPAMTNTNGKDYAVSRRLATAEVNAVVAGIRQGAAAAGREPVDIVVNDSHGDHHNLLIEELAAGVAYIQGSIKPYGMVQGLDASFDAVMMLGYHVRAGTHGLFAHTGSGLVRHLEINSVPAGETEMNAALAGALGVPVVLVAGDAALVQQVAATLGARSVVTKTAVTNDAAVLRPLADVRNDLEAEAAAAIQTLDRHRPWRLQEPVTVDLVVNDVTHCDIATGIPGVMRTSPTGLRFEASDMGQAYRLIRILYRFLGV